MLIKQNSAGSSLEPTVVTYPSGLYWSAIGLALVSVAIHVYFGIFVFTGMNTIPMLGIAIVYLVGVGLVISNTRRGLWFRVGTVWATVLVILWALAAFLGNAPHTTDLLAYVVNVVEVGLVMVLLAIPRYSKISTKT